MSCYKLGFYYHWGFPISLINDSYGTIYQPGKRQVSKCYLHLSPQWQLMILLSGPTFSQCEIENICVMIKCRSMSLMSQDGVRNFNGHLWTKATQTKVQTILNHVQQIVSSCFCYYTLWPIVKICEFIIVIVPSNNCFNVLIRKGPITQTPRLNHEQKVMKIWWTWS